MNENAETAEITCAVTGAAAEVALNRDGTPKLPRGWKRLAGRSFSPEGVEAYFVPPSVRLPAVNRNKEKNARRIHATHPDHNSRA